MMNSNILNKEVTVLYLLSKGPIYGRLRLQKLMFLAKEKFLAPIPFKFVIYHYGPYSLELQRVIDNLVMSGLVREDIVKHEDRILYKYELTEKGKIILKLLQPNEDVKKGIDETFKWYGKEKTNKILREVYELLENRPTN